MDMTGSSSGFGMIGPRPPSGGRGNQGRGGPSIRGGMNQARGRGGYHGPGGGHGNVPTTTPEEDLVFLRHEIVAVRGELNAISVVLREVHMMLKNSTAGQSNLTGAVAKPKLEF